jgi:hypothetical protein
MTQGTRQVNRFRIFGSARVLVGNRFFKEIDYKKEPSMRRALFFQQSLSTYSSLLSLAARASITDLAMLLGAGTKLSNSME